ncbi:MAG: CIA30 family protein [Candidatus Marinimicrobia bacterium]|nr:CIA30 family protein [Candidatus Neomarinimicrobiota bacterium]
MAKTILITNMRDKQWNFSAVLGVFLATAWAFQISAEDGFMLNNSSSGEVKVLFDFRQSEQAEQWYPIDDRVMGGISQSTFESSENNTAIFTGKVSLENNGGFASVRMESDLFDLSHYSGIILRVKSDGKDYNLNLKTDPNFSGVYFQAAFSPPADEWSTVKLPFSAFRAKIRGKYVDDQYALNPADIRSFGFMISDKQNGPFQLQVDSIAAYREE